MLGEVQKYADVTALKVASCRGIKENYLSELHGIRNKQLYSLNQVETSLRGELAAMKEKLSQLRRETRSELKALSQEVGELEQELKSDEDGVRVTS